MVYDAIVIGAGASGLYCAAHITGKNILILEKNKRVGLKVLASGSGQCNFTHGGHINAFYNRYGAHKKFVKSALSRHDNRAVIQFFKRHGVEHVERSDGKVFPKSLRAADVVGALLQAVKQCTLMVDNAVRSVSVHSDGFEVVATQGTFLTKCVVIATGGRSYPTMGSTGDGYTIARSIGVQVTDIKPGLTGVVLREKELTSLQGLSFTSVGVTHLRGVKTENVYSGDLLLTHFGLSGPVIINNSRDFKKGDQLKLNFLGVQPDLLEKQFLDTVAHNGDKPLSYFLNQLNCPEALKQLVLLNVLIDRNAKLSTINRDERKGLIEALTAYKVEIENLIGFQQAMVTVGGVALEGIHAKTMESIDYPGLFFIGEVLDVDGDTGGYNLQWAFASGYAAAMQINEIVGGSNG